MNDGCQALGRVGSGKLFFNECTVLLWDNEKVLEIDNDDGCTAVRIYLMSLNCKLKMGKVK